MNIILSSKRHHYLARASIFLITVALVVGMVGCGPFLLQYNLTISSTEGGEVTTPGEETFTYDKGTVVSLVAETEEGYYFVNWTGDVGTIADVNAATTNITMNGDYSLTANFVAGYELTITSTAWGSVTTPREGTFTYSPGTVVSLVAEADEGYQFGNWYGNVGTIADVYDATTTITMNDSYYIIANFELDESWYSLTIHHSSGGGSVTEPGEGTFHYDEGTVVDLVAEVEEGYHFVSWTGGVDTFFIADVNDATTNITMYDSYVIRATFGWSTTNISQIDANAGGGWGHTVGLESDGTVVAVGYNGDGECNVGGWTDITQVAAGGFHTVGLKDDGTVVATGHTYFGECNVGGWSDIVHVTAGRCHTVGVKTDGTVVAVGDNSYGEGDVGGWSDIVHVTAGQHHTVGLESDGTVVAVGENGYGQCNVGGWTDITQVAAGRIHTVGVKTDGTVVAVGENCYGQCNVGGWTDIIQVAAGYGHTVGVKSDGTVVAVGLNDYGQCNVGGWTDIVQVAAGSGWGHTLGLESDGTVVAVGENDQGQCNVGG